MGVRLLYVILTDQRSNQILTNNSLLLINFVLYTPELIVCTLYGNGTKMTLWYCIENVTLCTSGCMVAK